jgi:hypothetical protein
MLVIRRLETRTQGYTVIMLPPDYRKVIPTDEREHNDILRIFKQDQRYRDVLNDFTNYDIRPDNPAV